jgi:hypothetical protein
MVHDQGLGGPVCCYGDFVSAAELYEQIELWDEVVECYRRSGKENRAEEIVRDRLSLEETPRMWTALGDLTQDPRYYEKAVELSRGRFSQPMSPWVRTTLTRVTGKGCRLL